MLICQGSKALSVSSLKSQQNGSFQTSFQWLAWGRYQPQGKRQGDCRSLGGLVTPGDGARGGVTAEVHASSTLGKAQIFDECLLPIVRDKGDLTGVPKAPTPPRR